MNSIPPQQLLAQLNWRYATKQFDPQRKINPECWAALEDALVLSPSSFGLQPWKFLVVTDPAMREKLLPASWGQRQVVDASHLVVFTIKQHLSEQSIAAYVNRMAEVRGVTPESLAGYRDMMVGSLIKGRDEVARQLWAANQVYLALGNFLTSAALLGIDACPMEGIEPAQYDNILGLNSQSLRTVVVATAGYRARGDKSAGAKKVRFANADVLAEV